MKHVQGRSVNPDNLIRNIKKIGVPNSEIRRDFFQIEVDSTEQSGLELISNIISMIKKHRARLYKLLVAEANKYSSPLKMPERLSYL